MRPARAAPGVPFVYSRYASARAFATAIIAAFRPGGVIQTSVPNLRLISSDSAVLLSRPTDSHAIGISPEVTSKPRRAFVQAALALDEIAQRFMRILKFYRVP